MSESSSRSQRVEVIVNDRMQREYRYERVAPEGQDFDPAFIPELTPVEMLALGVFCGRYVTDCRGEFPESWFANARLATGAPDCSLNFFSVQAGKPLTYWRAKAGFTLTILAAGSSGTADTTRAGGWKTTRAR